MQDEPAIDGRWRKALLKRKYSHLSGTLAKKQMIADNISEAHIPEARALDSARHRYLKINLSFLWTWSRLKAFLTIRRSRYVCTTMQPPKCPAIKLLSLLIAPTRRIIKGRILDHGNVRCRFGPPVFSVFQDGRQGGVSSSLSKFP